MIRIGDFARLGQVSVATLRHYDEAGLLRPAQVDASTSYRYYAIEQLARLNRILALKDLGFRLEQIGRVLDGVSLEELRGMLKLKQAEVEQSLAMEQARLVRIESRLRQIELESEMKAYDVVFKEIAPIRVASRTVTIPTNDQAGEVLGAAFDETYRFIAGTQAKAAGPCLALWHQAAAVLENEVAEAAVPIDRDVPGSERVAQYDLPGGPVAAAVHDGPFATMTGAHAVLLDWIETNGYRVAGPYREVYLREGSASADPITEIQYPVVKAS